MQQANAKRTNPHEHIGTLQAREEWMKAYGHQAYLLYSLLFEDCPEEDFNTHMSYFDFVGAIWQKRSDDDQAMVLVGFSATTMLPEPFTIDGIDCYIVTNGPTVISPEGWGSRMFFKQLAMFVAERLPSLKAASENPVRVFFALLSEGVKSYLFLKNNFPSYYPRWDAPQEAATLPSASLEAKLLQVVGAYLGETEWRPEQGTVDYETGEGRLRPELRALAEARLAPNVRLFVCFRSNNPLRSSLPRTNVC